MTILEKLHDIEDNGQGLTLFEVRLVAFLLAEGNPDAFSILQTTTVDHIHAERVPS